jgi:peptidoglycan hydrolase-like protein with peptidoglycan-binding domain
MRWEARGTIALLVSALVGVTAGAVVGLTTGGQRDANANDDPRSGPSATPASNPGDPMGLGVPLENVDCIGKKILVVGWGETSGKLASAIARNPGGEVKYLETANSCDTLYGPENQPQPTYAVYLGPFDSNAEPCLLRMSVDHQGDAVISLKPGQKTHVPCLCVLRPDDMPELSIGMNPSTRDGIYIRALQEMLLDIGYITASHVTGHFDRQTKKAIVELQKLNALTPAKYGTVERLTWAQVIDRGCVGFDF